MKSSRLLCPVLAALISAVALAPGPAFAQTQALTETAERKTERMQWWTDARFGMFIHWGLYAVPAGEWKEGKN